jgi:two-component system sensor histidine kinase UhpB
VLLLVNACVFWLVGRAVQPFARIVGALQSLRQGRFDVQLPPLKGREAAAMGLAFNRMVSELQTHMETERRAIRAESQLSDSRELTRWLERHVEEERRMIARELHDEFGQSVTAIRSMATSIAQRNGATETGQAASLIAQEASRLYEAMHGIIPRLTPLVLDSFGLTEALADLVERTCKSQPEVVIDTRVDLAGADLGPEVTLTFYRAAQEGITNALRHGKARHLSLSVVVQDGEVRMRLRDDGRGLAPASTAAPAEVAPGGYGLRWLRERVEGLGGTVTLEDVPPRGTQLLVCVPLAPATAPARRHAGLVTP